MYIFNISGTEASYYYLHIFWCVPRKLLVCKQVNDVWGSILLTATTLPSQGICSTRLIPLHLPLKIVTGKK